MSFRGKGRGRGRSGERGDYSSKYSEHDDRGEVSNRDYDRSSYQGKMGGGSYRSNYRGRRGGGGNYRGSRGNYNNSQKNNYRGNRGRRPYYRGGSSRGKSNDSSNNRLDTSPLDDDGDVNMDGEAQQSARYKPYERQRTGRNQRSNQRSRPSQEEKEWYQISILDGHLYDEEWLKEEIQNTAFVQFHPIQYHLDGQKSSFFLEDRTTAEAIRECTKKIIGPDGNKLVILMRTSRSPPFSDAQIEKIKEVLGRRFSSANQHLDASSLFHDSALNEAGIQLKVGPVSYHFFVVAKIIAENISSLVSLDLSQNILGNLDALKLLVPLTPCLKKLNLEKNNIKFIKELEKLKDWNLSSLTLNNNPVCGDYKSTTEYISDTRNIFPELTTLDGHNLPAPVVFPVDSSEIPKPIRDYMPDNGREAIRQFVQQYFSCYDSSRSDLTEAYNENTVFTFSVPSSPRGPSLSKYYQLSRNLKRMKNSSLKTSSVCIRRDEALKKLAKLPLSKHLLTSFSIDVPLVTSTIVNFIVRGLFKEVGRDGFLRAFSRSFFCQVESNGLKIINEQYFIRNPTSNEIKESKKPATSAPSTSKTTQPQAKTVALTTLQMQMVEAFVRESGMNAMFSEQCLKENNWNYEAAGKVFLTLKEQGKIPPEAFK